MKKPCQLIVHLIVHLQERGGGGYDMFGHEDIIIVVSYYEKLGRVYRPSCSHFVCVFGGGGDGEWRASCSHLCVPYFYLGLIKLSIFEAISSS
jgi:hypothetical protein